MLVRRITETADVLAAAELFDSAPRVNWTERFLADPLHHLFLAYVDERPVGMITGVETTHPDKGTEMFLYELSVHADHRRRGIGRALVSALAELATQRGCYGMWVGAELDNEAALATYRSAGGRAEGEFAMLGWKFTATNLR